MKIVLITPAPPHTRLGNRNTAIRWAHMLRDLGHQVEIGQQWDGAPCDLMIALHARRSHESILRYSERFPRRPLIVTLTGTDLYRDIRSDAAARLSLKLATRLIVLHELGAADLPARHRMKTRVVVQSAEPVRRLPPLASCFEVVVCGHLRQEKDPFRAAAALHHLPAASRIRVTHLGGALTPEMADEARRWMAADRRYRWLGELAHWRALQILARSPLMVISSVMEGGANVVCEALAARTPIIASRVAGNVGMLGRDYGGYYPVGNESALARTLWHAESDPVFYRQLQKSCAARRALVTPSHERQALRAVLAEFD
ncbi:MAG TPA: selenoneine biosynthesis selenosugar synthase SenB [Burkholderiales bacterium]|nr:selenoneine biosynthesis selenosugar synthase SenB [Burkholderiales bacterium]